MRRRYAIVAAAALLAIGPAIAQITFSNGNLVVKTPPTKFTAFEIKVTLQDGTVANEKFFEGRLPEIGETVCWVYVGLDDDNPGAMRFQMKVCP